jgi:ribosome-binding ATPase
LFSQEKGHEARSFVRNALLISSRNSTIGDVARKVMGDIPVAYVEGAGGVRVSEDEIVKIGERDVCTHFAVSRILPCRPF